jgi:uncharacterized protein YndB with AHSA1/START domain
VDDQGAALSKAPNLLTAAWKPPLLVYEKFRRRVHFGAAGSLWRWNHNQKKGTEMKLTSLTLLLLPLVCGQIGAIENSAPDSSSLMAGKMKTDHTIFLEATVHARPSEVFRLWTSAEGVKKFFAPDARIGSAPGEQYQIIFFPSKDPEGDSHGTRGAHILKFVPGKELAFEWITFAGDDLLGKNAPPYARPAQRNVTPLPTWVELSFEPIAGQPNQTHLKFAHYGFREGELWAQSYQWFTRAWKGVLDQLTNYCENQQHI